MAAYSLLPVGVKRTSDGAQIVPQSGAAWETYQAWLKAGGVPGPYVPPATPAETLAEAKSRRKWEIKRDGLARMQTRLPALDAFDMVQLMREIYLSVAPAARQPTTDLQWIIDTYQAGNVALAQVAASTTIAQVNAVTPAWPA